MDVNGTKLEVKDGQINLAGDTDNLVTWTALNTAFTIDIVGAKADKVKTS